MKKTALFIILLLILLAACQPAAAPATITSTPPAPTTPSTTPSPTIPVTPTGAALPSETLIVDGNWRITGPDVPALNSFDNTLQTYMQKHGIRAGALAVTYKGRLIMAHAYTQDNDRSYTTQPTSLFRIASLSKPITAVAVLKLAQEGQLGLDEKITSLLSFIPPAGQTLDPRLEDVSVADLLYHQGGWDIDALGYDPMFNDFQVSESLGVPLPVSQENIITFMSGVPLSFDPGTKYAYSNYGYMLLGRIIEAVSKQPYQTYVKENVLAPLGMLHTQQGRTLPENRSPAEVSYQCDFTGPTVFDSSYAQVPWPDGAWNLENMDAHGGWISSVVDMARFEASFDQPQNNPVLSRDSITLMFQAPPGTDEGNYYAMGWSIVPTGGGTMNTWHSGSLDGTLTLMVRRYDGVGWVAFFNQRNSADDPSGDSFWEIDGLLHVAADAVKTWPEHDLFAELP